MLDRKWKRERSWVLNIPCRSMPSVTFNFHFVKVIPPSECSTSQQGSLLEASGGTGQSTADPKARGLFQLMSHLSLF